MVKHAVVTLAIGDQPFWELTHPIMQAYAHRIGADFVVINQPQRSTVLPDGYKLGKFELWDYLERYERVLFLDGDIVVHPQCPNLFEIVDKDSLGVVCERLPCFNRETVFQEACKFYDVPYPGNSQDWFNTGMMVLSDTHRQLFAEPEKIKAFRARNLDGSLASERFSWLDMPLLNCRRIAYNFPLQDLGYSFNYLQPLINIDNPPSHAEDAWIFHGAGEDKSSLYRIAAQWHPSLKI